MSTNHAEPGAAGSSQATIAVVGAGPGIGASVGRRFARAGYSIGLIARSGERLAQMASELAETAGVKVGTATGDATDPEQVRRALQSLTEELGEPSALCFSPIPDVGLIRPVLETRPEEFMASLRLNIAGAAAAVESVLPGMRSRGHGSLLFTTGSAAIQPDPRRAASAVTTTAATTYISLLRQALADTDIRVGHAVIVGPIAPGQDNSHDPDDIAANIWAQHRGEVDQFPSVLRLP